MAAIREYTDRSKLQTVPAHPPTPYVGLSLFHTDLDEQWLVDPSLKISEAPMSIDLFCQLSETILAKLYSATFFCTQEFDLVCLFTP